MRFARRHSALVLIIRPFFYRIEIIKKCTGLLDNDIIIIITLVWDQYGDRQRQQTALNRNTLHVCFWISKRISVTSRPITYGAIMALGETGEMSVTAASHSVNCLFKTSPKYSQGKDSINQKAKRSKKKKLTVLVIPWTCFFSSPDITHFSKSQQ